MSEPGPEGLMSGPPEAVLPVVPAEQGVRGVTHYETEPDSITWHKIWDYELESMTNISRPIVLGLSTMFIGGALGLLPVVRDAFEHVTSPGLDEWDLAMLLVAGGCWAFGVAFGFFATLGQIDAYKMKRTIRGRNAHQINAPGGGVHGVSA